MEDLEGAYNSALNAEGSALKENEAYLDSIQGRIDLFNNSVQTMWMNLISSDVIKFVVDLGTGLVNLVDKVGLLRAGFVGLMTYLNVSSKSSLDFASMLGIHDLKKGWTVGKDGLTGWVTEQFKHIKIEKGTKNNLLKNVLGDTGDVEVTIQDFANAIKDNINDFVTLDTSQIDTQIDIVQKKLSVARQELVEAQQADWNYYKSLGSTSPATDRDTRIDEKIQEIRILEAELSSLQVKRDEIVSSAADEVATSAVSQVQSESKAYQSMLPILSEVKDMRLSIGDEQDVANKIDEISKAAQNGQAALVDYVSTLGNNDIALKAYVASVDDGKYSLAGFQKYIQQHNSSIVASGAAAAAAAVGHQLLNAAISMGISFILSVAISAITKYINKQKEIEEAASQAEDAIKSLSDAFKTDSKTVTDYAERFAELAQGVDMLTGKNLSLTADDYEEFLNLSNQLAEIFPTLSRNYDENGNAIVQLSGDTDTMVGSLKELLDVQRQITNQQIAENLPALYKGVKQKSDNYNRELDQLIADRETLEGQLKDIQNNDINLNIDNWIKGGVIDFDKQGRSAAEFNDMVNDYIKILKDAGFKLEYLSTDYEFDKENMVEMPISFHYKIANLDYMSEDDIESAKGKISSGIDAIAAQYATDINNLSAEIETTTNENKANWNSLSSAIAAWLQTDSTYQVLDDDMQSMVQTIINNLDYSSLDFSSWEKAQGWIQENILDIFTNPEIKDKAATELSKMFNLQSSFQSGKIDLGGYKEQLLAFVDFVKKSGLTDEVQTQLLKMFNIDPENKNSLGSNIDTMLNHAKSVVKTTRNVIKNELERLGEGGTVDLVVRPIVSASVGRAHEWDIEDGDIATVLTNTFSNEDGTIAMNFTPIIVDENGKFKSMLTPDELQTYAEEVIAGTREDDLKLQIGASYSGADAIEQAERDARTIHELHDMYFSLGGNKLPWDELSYSDLQIINSAQFNVDGSTIATWEQLQYEIQQAKIAMTQDFTTDNFADYAEGISTISSSISTYQEAIESLESGTFTITDFMKLIEQFPDLADGVDLASGEFKGLASNLSKAIRNSPDDLVDELKDLRENLILAGKSTDSIDQLIESVQNMPSDVVSNMSAKYATLTEEINAAARAQNKLKEAMDENPNEGFETRGGAIEQMKDLMSKGMIGSESELWSVAEAYGFTYDSAKTINENADALYKFIQAREQWYAKDSDGNYTYKGTENFIEDVEKVVSSNEKLQQMGVKWSYENGVLDFDFNNADWDEIVQILGESEELAGLTSEEFYDLLMQVGQFFDINWQDADDMLWFLEQIDKNSKSASENFDGAKGAVKSFLESSDISLDWLDKDINIVDTDEFKKLPEEVRKVLAEYYKIKKEFEEDPLGINFQLNKDSETNLKNGLSDESLASINKLTSTAHDASTGVTWLSLDDLKTQAEEAGMNVDELIGHLEKLKEAGKIIDLKTTSDDPLGLVEMQHDAETTATYLRALGVAGSELDGAFTINVPSFIDMMVAAGWSSEQIETYISTLSAQGYTFIYTNEENVVQTLDVNTEEGKQKVEELVNKSNELTDTENLTVNIDGTAEGAIKQMKETLEKLTTGTHEIKINVTTTGDSIPSVNGSVHANGTAHMNGTAYKSGTWGAQKTEASLTGELGPELLVRGNKWTLVGENGAEFTQIKKGDIIFNHKQTEDLLSKGYVTGRGKAYAGGTAYASGGGMHKKYYFGDTTGSGSSALSAAADKLSKAADKFKEIFDWIEVRIEEITEALDLKNAKLDNAVGYLNQNSIVDDMIEINEQLYKNLIAGAQEYNAFAEELLKKVPKKYREMAQDGAIAIETFAGDADEKTLEAIKEYREWVQKGADATQQAEETLTEISDLAKQAIDNIATDFENKNSIRDNKIDQLEAYNGLAEAKYGNESASIYEAIIKETKKNISALESQRDKMQAVLNKQVEAGNIEKYSQNWYDAINDIAAVDTEIIELTKDTYDYQDAINELHWDNFDNLMSRFEAISDEADNLIDILGSKDLVDKDTGEWTDEGVTTLGLYAQQMEVAEMQAKKYEEEIKYLNKNWKKLGYTEQEYVEKLDELKDGQYDAIKSYNDTKDAIVDLNKERVDAIKDGIQKEIDAYSELIEKKKEELDTEKDLYDFQKNIADKQKNIADIERKLAALSADSSASARAKRAQLEADLAEAQQELQDAYYDRSISDQQDALDKELENFQNEKDAELDSWDEYLENTEQVVSDSLTTIQENTNVVYQTLQAMGQEYSLSIAEALTSPWEDGEAAIQSYSEKFGLSMSSTVEELQKLADEFKKVMDEIEGYGDKVVGQVNKNAETYQGNNKPQDNNKEDDDKEEVKTIKVGGKINAGSAKIYDYVGDLSGNKQYYSADPIYKVLAIDGNWVQVRHKSLKSGVTGWFKKSDVKAYAKGTTSIPKDQWSLIDELGEELQLIPDGNGRLAYMKKGTGVVPADLTSNLMEWGKLDPSTMLDQNRPQIAASPSVVNNTTEIHIDNSVGELIHVERLDGNNPAELTKIVDKAWDKHMKELNAHVRRYTNR